nr:uncharacterized protein LOC107418293 [Ziziphus jujuba var. spinosa]
MGFSKSRASKLGKSWTMSLMPESRLCFPGLRTGTSSMVAAICYAWLLENRMRKESKDGEEFVVIPVMNVRREKMWKQKQAAWLFYHVGLEVNSLFFADEVDVEGLMMAGKLSMLVVGQDVLETNGEDGSQCTILTDNYCEDAYDLLQTPVVKKLLLAAILLDTQNLNASSQISMTRDAEAVQLLLVGSTPNYRNSLFNQLIQDQSDNSFFEALQCNYGVPLDESGYQNGEHVEHGVSERKSTSIPHREDIVQYSDKKSNNARSEKATKVSPKSGRASSSGPKVPSERKSRSIPDNEGSTQNSDKKSIDARSEKPTKISQKSVKSSSSSNPKAPSPPDPPRGKNKFFLAKWFGL